jgi:GDP-mannose 6-dehydrogenase
VEDTDDPSRKDHPEADRGTARSIPDPREAEGDGMRISVFGLGYVGVTSAACLVEMGHEVIGVDVNPDKVEMVANGQTPIVEERIGDLVAAGVASGRLRATMDTDEGVETSDLALVCVGTPARSDGSTELGHVVNVAEAIGAALRRRRKRFTVAVRSTVPPGTTRGSVLPVLESSSGMKAGRDIGLCMHPEFLREGTSVYDFFHPPKVVVGSLDEASAEPVVSFNHGLDAPLFVCGLETAEMVKYVDNSWHALKVVFGNEIGSLCKALEIDSHEVMDLFVQDTKLNISAKYLRPGYAFGGSCLPKDVRGIRAVARSLNLDLPVLDSILRSNDEHITRAFRAVTRFGRRPIGVLGLSFKEGTDDLRESPVVDLVERLIGKGFDVRVYDRNVNLSRLIGANRRYILEHIPHIDRLLEDDAEGVLEHAEVVVVANNDPAYAQVLHGVGDKVIVDLVRIDRDLEDQAGYHGFVW